MHKLSSGIVLASLFITNQFAMATTIKLPSIVRDNFNTYAAGSIVGQGGWDSYVNGSNFVVEDNVGRLGNKAVFNNALADSVINKTGTAVPDGRQILWIKTIDRSNWGSYTNGNAQVRISKGSWGGSETRNFIAVSFKDDGAVAYYDQTSDSYVDFATYNDSEWTELTMEWRSSDQTARYRINRGTWTTWQHIAGSGTFTDFDTVGFDFILPSGSGGVYFDSFR